MNVSSSSGNNTARVRKPINLVAQTVKKEQPVIEENGITWTDSDSNSSASSDSDEYEAIPERKII